MKIKRIIIVCFVFIALIGVYVGGIALFAFMDWQNNKIRLLNNLNEYHNKIKNFTERNKYIILDHEGKITEVQPTRIYDRNQALIGEFSPTKREIVRFENIPKNLIKSLIYIEDRAFYTHHGVNYKGISRAFVKNISKMRVVEGGSTITQQLAKILFTSRKRNLYRKFLELFGALNTEKNFSKDDILLMYLNTIYFGHGVYGLQSAARLYFNKNIRNLDQFEIALLISLIPAPNYFSPFNNIELSKKKHLIVLKSLIKSKLISTRNFSDRYDRFWNSFMTKRRKSVISYWKMNVNKAPYPVEYIRQYLNQRFSVPEILQGSLNVNTTLDMRIQNVIQSSMQDYFNELRTVFTNIDNYKRLQVAVMVNDPETGNILGFMGGRNYSFKNQLNRAFKIKRQIGSLIKPFIYNAAIEEKMFSLVSVLTDKPVKYKDKNRIYAPKNYSSKYRGEMLFQEALYKSINTVSVQILNRLTPELFLDKYFKNIYNDIAIDIEFLPVLSLALGTIEMSPFDVAIAYSSLANNGNKIFPLLIKDIKDHKKDILIDNESIQSNFVNKWIEDNDYKVFSDGASYIIMDTLKKVFSKKGTVSYAIRKNPLKVEISGKTGTTGEFKDAWCTGFTREYNVVVWFGYDDNVSLGKGMTGGRIAGPLILKIFNQLYWNRKFAGFKIPADEIIFCDIDKNTGKLAYSLSTNILYKVPFLNGTEPAGY